MYVCVRVRVCEEAVHEKKSKQRVMKMRREEKEKWKRKEREKRKHKLIHTDKQTDRQTDRQTDGQIDTNHSFIWDTILKNIVNGI